MPRPDNTVAWLVPVSSNCLPRSLRSLWRMPLRKKNKKCARDTRWNQIVRHLLGYQCGLSSTSSLTSMWLDMLSFGKLASTRNVPIGCQRWLQVNVTRWEWRNLQMWTIPIEITIWGFFPGSLLPVPFMDYAFSFQNVEDIVTVVWQGDFVTDYAVRLHG